MPEHAKRSVSQPVSLSQAVVDGDSLPDLVPSLTKILDTRGWLLVCGDAYHLLSLLPRDCIDLIITSPPYWGHRSYGQDHNWNVVQEWRDEGNTDDQIPPYDWYKGHGGILGLEPIPDWFVFHLVEILNRAKNCLKAGGSLWVNLGDTYFARWSSIRDQGRQGLGNNKRERRRTPMGEYRQEKQLLLIPARFAIAMQSERWILRNDLIWYKPNVPPRPERDRLRLAHEHFYHFVKRPKEGRARYHYELRAAEPEMNDVVTYNVRAGNNGHSATFPRELIAPRIATSCPRGGIVLDPFCGSGRAISVALDLYRRAIGFDIVKDFLLTATKDLAQGRLPR